MINVNSFQSLGAVDGPGVRFVVFLQGCNFRCKYCHNPETLEIKENQLYSATELFNKVKRYESYIKENGGVTVSGGEPLLQANELVGFFRLLKENGYHTAIDTNGSVYNDDVNKLFDYTDLILLDLKMPDNELYREYIKADIFPVIDFLNTANEKNKKVWIRQVVVEGVNDTNKNINFLRQFLDYENVEKIQLLPFKKICIEKYRRMNMKFEMEDFNETSEDTIKRMYELILS